MVVNTDPGSLNKYARQTAASGVTRFITVVAVNAVTLGGDTLRPTYMVNKLVKSNWFKTLLLVHNLNLVEFQTF